MLRPQEASSDRELVVLEATMFTTKRRIPCEIDRAVARPVPKIVLPHLDVENPMKSILDRPVAPDGLQEDPGRPFPAPMM